MLVTIRKQESMIRFGQLATQGDFFLPDGVAGPLKSHLNICQYRECSDNNFLSPRQVKSGNQGVQIF